MSVFSSASNRGRCDVLVVLGHVVHVRNFVASGFIEFLANQGLRLVVIAPEDLLETIRTLAPGVLEVVALEQGRLRASRRKLLHWLRIGSMVHRRRFIEYRKKLEWAASARFSQRLAIRFWTMVDHWMDAEAVAAAWVMRLPASRPAKRLVEQLSPRLVLWPTTISDPGDFEIVKASSEAKIPLLMFEGSWDNLVGKGGIWPRPKHLLVWGDFSRKYALEHHGFDGDQVTVTGPPHFDVYGKPQELLSREGWFKAHGLAPAKKLIFIGGTTVGSKAEPELIHLLSAWIDAGRIPPAYIWYRPHPKALVRRRFDREALAAIAHVVIDPGVEGAEHLPKGRWLVDSQDAAQRANALAACDVMLSSFSTVVLEAALLGKPSILVSFGKQASAQAGSIRSYLEFAHVRLLAETPWIQTAYQPVELEEKLNSLLMRFPPAAAESLRSFGATIAHCLDGQARNRLADVVLSMLDGPGNGKYQANKGLIAETMARTS